MFGGTFDPVHNAHLRVALDVLESGQLERLHLVPCHVPPHRGDPEVTAEQRLAMLRRGVGGVPGFRVDDRELRRNGPSYTLDTLHSLRDDDPDATLCLLLGTDSFLSLPRWHRWEELAEVAHFVVLERPEHTLSLPDELEHWLRGREVSTWSALREALAGRVLFQSVTAMAISATAIRERLRQGYSARFLLPDAVWDYIRDNGLYGVGAGGAG